jgi:hypothetical protein
VTDYISLEDYHAMRAKTSTTKRGKYNNVKVTVNGEEFDSKAEARRAGELRMLEAAGTIAQLRYHVPFVLQEGFRDRSGTWHRAITYEADFVYVEAGGQIVAEDCKGKETEVFKLKRKLFLRRYPDIVFRVSKARS